MGMFCVNACGADYLFGWFTEHRNLSNNKEQQSGQVVATRWIPGKPTWSIGLLFILLVIEKDPHAFSQNRRRDFLTECSYFSSVRIEG